MWEERQKYEPIWPSLLALGASALVALIVLVDLLGMVAQR